MNAKYLFQYVFDVADLNIDRTKPILEVIKIDNTNIGYKKYANKTHEITVRIKFIEKNIGNDVLEKNEIEILIDDLIARDCVFNINKIEQNQGYAIYDIKISNLNENGKLTLNILEGAITDLSGLKNDKTNIDTEILIDNIAPIGKFTEELIEEGKVKGKITVNEEIREVEGWTLSDDNKLLTNEFANNLYYELDIVDFAQNESKVEVHISKATNIVLTYASHNSEYAWSYGYSNYDIAGKEAAKRDSRWKTEAMAFSITGNVPEDFLQVRAYDHTYWGPGGASRCSLSGNKYLHGYNPSESTWQTMNADSLIMLDGKEYFELGGAGVNYGGTTDINGKNPIKNDDSKPYQYGISGISMKLKSTSYYTVIYQIFVDKVGWIAPKSDGEECIYRKDKPFSAFRMALIPKNQKQYVLNMWNDDVGSFRLE